MESPKEPLDMNPEAFQTTQRILVHILAPLSDYDRRRLIEELCDLHGVREYDSYDY